MSKKDKLIIIAAVFLLVTAFSQNKFQVTLFPATIAFNGAVVEDGSKYEILNYNDRAYVPIRFIAEQMGGDVSYDADKKEINIKHLDQTVLKSKLNASYTEGPYQLSVYSGEKVYSEGEPIEIWSTLKNISEYELSMFNNLDVIEFGVYGEEMASGEMIETVGITYSLEPNGVFRKTLPLYLIQQYNYEMYKKDNESIGEFLSRFPNHSTLPKGTYTIVVRTNLTEGGLPSKDTDRTELEAEISIEVK